MPTNQPPEPLVPLAANLRRKVAAQLATPSAMLIPAGLRHTIEILAGLVSLMAERIDTLQPPPKG